MNTVHTKELLDCYAQTIYPRHIGSFLFGIEAHGFWTVKEGAEPRLFVLASYAAGEEPVEVTRRYMQSAEFADDIKGFDAAHSIVSVDTTILTFCWQPPAGDGMRKPPFTCYD